MDILGSIIQNMSKEEVRNFKLYANRSHSSENRKDIQLFDYFRKSGEHFSESKIIQDLYGKVEKNSYYRLKNRLFTELGKSLTLLHIDENKVTNVLNYLILGILYREKQLPEIAHALVHKAEIKARDIGSNELLDLIYGELILLSYDVISINPEEYIHKRNENSKILDRLRQIENILAAVSHRVRVSQNFAARKEPILQVLEETIAEFAEDPGLLENQRLRLRMYEAVSRLLLRNNDFQAMEAYIEKTFLEFTQRAWFNKENHQVKLEMLTYMINALFKNGKITESLAWTEKLKEAMNQYDRLFYDRYLFFYYNTLATNYSTIDLDKAIDILQSMQGIDVIMKVPVYQLYILLNLSVFWYMKGHGSKALQHLVRLRLLDAFVTADASMKFKIAIFEVMIRVDLDDIDVIQYRIHQLKQEFKIFFKTSEYDRDRQLLTLIERMLKVPVVKEDIRLVAQIQKFIETQTGEGQDIIQYENWLSERIS